MPDDCQAIECPRCSALNEVSRNNCARCGVPFTLEGTEQAPARNAGSNFGLPSFILGLISLPLSVLVVPPILAIVFGVLALRQQTPAGIPGRWQPIAGIVLAVLGVIIAVAYHLAA